LALFDTWCEISHGGLPEITFIKGMNWYRSREGIQAAHKLRRSMAPQNPHFSYGVSDFPLEDYGTGLITGQTTRFLAQHQETPFALWVSYPDPHEPWVVPQKYFDMFPPDVIDLPPWRDGEFEESSGAPERNRILYRMLGMEGDALEDIYGVLGAYYGMVRFIDDGVGQILQSLEDLGLRENTIVVFCSDHGDFIGEHKMQCKGGVFYDALTHVPLIISWPEHIPQGVREKSMVNLVDIVPTLLQLQGLPVPRSMPEPGLPVATNAAPRKAVFSEYGAGGPAFTTADLEAMPKPLGRRALITSLHWREAEGRRKMVRTHKWKYVHDPMGDIDELYDLVKDPWELINVAGIPEHKAIIADLQRQLADWSIKTEDGKPVPLPDPETHW
jgi:arylsulfatase A-like enzyme